MPVIISIILGLLKTNMLTNNEKDLNHSNNISNTPVVNNINNNDTLEFWIKNSKAKKQHTILVYLETSRWQELYLQLI